MHTNAGADNAGPDAGVGAAQQMDKTTRRDLILRLISENPLGTQGEVVAALADEGVEVAQATVSRDLAELGVLKVGNRYLALPHEPGAAGIEVLPSFVLGVVPAQNTVVIQTRDGTAGAVANVLDRVKGLKVVGTLAGQDTVFAVAPDNAAAEEVASLIADVCRARTRPAGNVE
jgi:transcriptional regulator of arginine metabolism